MENNKGCFNCFSTIFNWFFIYLFHSTFIKVIKVDLIFSYHTVACNTNNAYILINRHQLIPVKILKKWILTFSWITNIFLYTHINFFKYSQNFGSPNQRTETSKLWGPFMAPHTVEKGTLKTPITIVPMKSVRIKPYAEISTIPSRIVCVRIPGQFFQSYGKNSPRTAAFPGFFRRRVSFP